MFCSTKATRDTHGHEGVRLTHEPYTPGLTSHQNNAIRQKSSQNPTSGGATAHTQYRTAENIGATPQRASGHTVPAGSTHRQSYELLGVGSQYSDKHFDTSLVQGQHYTAHTQRSYTCPYHGPISHDRLQTLQNGYGLGPMDRYLAEGPAERYALAHGSGNRYSSRPVGCTCFDIMRSMSEGNGYARS